MILFGCVIGILAVLTQARPDGHCVMRSSCDPDPLTYLAKPCLYNGSALPLNDQASIGILNDLCPDLKHGPNYSVCCDVSQVEVLNSQLEVLASIFKRCPSCYHNIANLFCQLTCSSTQSSYLKVTSSSDKSVDELDFYITEDFTTGLFNSCKDVKLGNTLSTAMEITCGDHGANCTPHLWMDYMGGHDPSPYLINFRYETSDKVTVKNETFYPMNSTIVPCSQAVTADGETCSSVDCPSDLTRKDKRPEGHCVMRSSCDFDPLTDLAKPCLYNGSALPLKDQASIGILNDLCPDLKHGPNYSVCCDVSQVEVLNIQLEVLVSLFKRCPSCYHNLANLFCQLTCSPTQSSYMKVTSSSDNSVDELDFYITEDFATGLFNSCKDVKLPNMFTAMEIACGAHGANCTPHLWLDFMGGHDPSPYQINFHYETSDKATVKNETFYPLNSTIVPCSQALTAGGEACSSVDCPSDPIRKDKRTDGQCIMHGSCDTDPVTGLAKPCAYNGSPIPLKDQASIGVLNDICPDLKHGPNFSVCCDASQIGNLRIQIASLAHIFKHCPSCYHNLVNLFCQLTCSPTQSMYLEVTSSSNKSVDELSYYIHEDFVTGLFDSCKNVRMPFGSYRAMEIACGAHGANCTPHLWLDYMGGHEPSPYQINFHYETSYNVTVKNQTFHPMNATIIPCSRAVTAGGEACSRLDCPLDPTPKEKKRPDGHCVMRGSCDIDPVTGLAKPCVYNGSAIPLNDQESIKILSDLCPDLEHGLNFSVCCDVSQIENLRIQMEVFASIFKHCPSCYHNLANLFCQFTCSSSQSSYLKVTSSSNKSVDEMSYYIHEDFVTGLFNSCKNVRIPFGSHRAMEIACGANGANCTPHLWLDYMGGHDPSPYQINFHYYTSGNVTMKNETFYPMNATIIPCSQTVTAGGEACRLEDCPLEPSR